MPIGSGTRSLACLVGTGRAVLRLALGFARNFGFARALGFDFAFAFGLDLDFTLDLDFMLSPSRG